MRKAISCTPFFIFLIWILLPACTGKDEARTETMADSPRELQEKTVGLIRNTIRAALGSGGNLGDSISLHQSRVVQLLYERTDYTPLWCHEQKWLSPGDSLFNFIQQAQRFGLFPENYHLEELNSIRSKFIADSLGEKERADAALWSRADMLMTDAFIQVVRDIKMGRLPNDSISQRRDSVLQDDFFKYQLDALERSGNLTQLLNTLEPKQRGYHLLKQGIPGFLDSADNHVYTLVPMPSKGEVEFRKALQKRLYEGGFIAFDSTQADSAQLADAVKKFQKQKGMAIDGRAGEATIRMLNVTDRERFIRIAISMDKYKMLPDTMPERYIWVNVSSNYLDLVEDDTVKFSSKVICGKPKTRTPLLTSYITELITYPQWVPPPSIIQKEILPAVKKNPGYLARKGFSLVDSKGEEVDPYTVDWTKYSKSIPYRVVQGSGDANALGIMKFVFSNKYSVYLHDTNQRYLFSNSMRSLSHGCVRVQDWEKLTYYILRTDSVQSRGSYARIDSVKSWLNQKLKKNIPVRNKLAVFIRYITCEGKGGKIVFYDDVYGEDKLIREKYFAVK